MAITNGYATLAEVKAALRLNDTIDDSLLEMAIESASRLVDGYSGRYFYNAGTATKNFAAQDNYIVVTEDLQSVSSLQDTNEIGGSYTTWDANEYQLEPLNGKADGIAMPYTQIRAVGGNFFNLNVGDALVRITGVWGWAAIPIAIKQATIIQASRIFKRLDSPLGVLSSPDLGFIRVGSRLDPDVAQLVDPYRTLRNFA
jgi:hypothetical protein